MRSYVLNGNDPVVEYASIIVSLIVIFFPVSCTFQAIGFRDLKCLIEALEELKFIR
jgi:hypothetical protein